MADDIQPEGKHFDVDELKLHYVDWGNHDAPTMLLVHGLQDCARSWDFFAANMSSDYRVLALDHRGHGDSDWAPEDGYRLRDYVSDIEALVRELEIDSMVLIAHSAGGRNAFVYTASHLEAVDALVIADIDPNAANPDSQKMFQRYQAESDEWESLDAVTERLRTRQPNSSPEMLAHQALHMTKELPDGRRVWKRDRKLVEVYERPDIWNEWYEVACPTLVVRGRDSLLLTHDVAVKMRDSVPQATLAEVDGGGHWFYREAPEAFEATVRDFLESLPD